MKRTLRFSLLTAFAIATLMAQRAGTAPPGGNSSTGTGTSSAPIQSSTPATTANPNINNPEASLPVFISGRIMVDDGSPAPQNIAIQQICANSPRTVAWTDGKGRFNFQVGHTGTEVMPDASESSRGMGRMGGNSASRGVMSGDPLVGCFVAGQYRRIPLRCRQPQRASRLRQLRRRNHRLAPAGQRRGHLRQRHLAERAEGCPEGLRKGRPVHAQSQAGRRCQRIRKSRGIYPKYANAWLDLGRVQSQQKSIEQARESFKKATDSDAMLVDPWVELGLLAAQSSNWPDTAQYLDRR